METKESNFNLQTCRALAKRAQAAYGSTDGFDPGAVGICGPQTDTHVFVEDCEGFLVVAFRGTASVRNWLTDLDANRVPFFGSGEKDEVHAGFDRALDEVSRQLEDALAQFPVSLPVYFTGHSLGGALAMLAAARWRQCHFREVAGVYTFGQPRVGNKAFKEWYDARLKAVTFRVVHAQDIVPRVPWLLNFYRHAGTEVFFDALGYKHFDLPWYLKAASDVFGTWAEWRRNFTVAQIADHSMERYLEVLGVRNGGQGTDRPTTKEVA